MSQIREDYIDTGKVEFVYKQLPVLGDGSVMAALASECAAEQDAFWEFHDYVFEDKLTARTPLTPENLSGFAGTLGLDVAQFEACIAAEKYMSDVGQDAMNAQSMGVRGTPAFLINGVFVTGAQPYLVFQQIIEEQLAAAE